MKQKILFLLLWLLMVSSNFIQAQRDIGKEQRSIGSVGFNYSGYNWTSGESIGLGHPSISGNANPQTIPLGNLLYTVENASLNFSVRFSDLDDATCSKGTNPRQFPSPWYKIEFASNNLGATFEGMPSIEVMIGQYQLYPNPLTPGDQYSLIFSENAILNISSTWDKKPILITLTILDRSSTPAMPDGETGNPDDPTFTYTWTINYASNCPTGMVKVTTAPENMWTTQPFTNKYGVLPDPPPTYENYLITESFSQLMGCGLFTINDLNPVWLSANPDVVDETTAVRKIFIPNNHGNTFTVNNLNQFEDFHDGLSLNQPYFTILQTHFKLSAIQADKAGYRIDQTFKCGDSIIGISEFCKRYKYVSPGGTDTEFKKKHNF